MTKEEKIANKMIQILRDAGYSYEEMPKIFRMAREMHEQLKIEEFEQHWNTAIVEKKILNKTRYYIHGCVTSTLSDTKQEAMDKYSAL